MADDPMRLIFVVLKEILNNSLVDSLALENTFLLFYFIK